MEKPFHGLLAFIAAVCLSATSAFALDINRASVIELQNVKGVGPVIAKRIASERRKSRFKSLADLQERVPGVGPKIAANLSRGSGLPKGRASAARPSKTAKGKVIEFADKRQKNSAAKSKKPKQAKKLAKATNKKKAGPGATAKLARKVSNKNK